MENKDLDKSVESNTIVYTISWNPIKSIRLKRIRGASFEDLFTGKLLDIRDNPGRSNQRMLIFEYLGNIWAAPCVIEGEEIFLKTLYRSRKYQRIYQKRRLNEKD
jgi:hypothetical protein